MVNTLFYERSANCFTNTDDPFNNMTDIFVAYMAVVPRDQLFQTDVLGATPKILKQ